MRGKTDTFSAILVTLTGEPSDFVPKEVLTMTGLLSLNRTLSERNIREIHLIALNHSASIATVLERGLF
jgi:hypothetical protein